MRVGESARREAAGSYDPDEIAPVAQRQQSRRCRLDQPIVVERAVGAGAAVESLIGCAEGIRQCRDIGFLGNGVCTNEHALGADADRSGATLRSGDDAAGQQMANTIDFRADAGTRLSQSMESDSRQDCPPRSAVEPIFRLGAANGRPHNATQRHP